METVDFRKDSFKLSARPLSSIVVYNTGVQRCEGGYRWGPGVRDHFLIHLVLSGQGSYSARDATYALRAGDLFLVRPDETISYAADADDPWHYCWVGFHGTDALSLLAQTDFTPSQPYLRLPDDLMLRPLLLAIYEARGSLPHDTARMAGRLYEFLAHLMGIAQRAAPGRIQVSQSHVHRACAYIAGNFADPITIESIARHAGVSRSLLYRAFRAELSLSPAAYLAQFRMRQACMLLRRQELSIKAVAFSVGYEEPLYFSRRFREIMGISPSVYMLRGEAGG